MKIKLMSLHVFLKTYLTNLKADLMTFMLFIKVNKIKKDKLDPKNNHKKS